MLRASGETIGACDPAQIEAEQAGFGGESRLEALL